MPYLEQQLKFLYFLQEWRGPGVDAVLIFFNFFDTKYFVYALIVSVWIVVSWRWGVRFTLLMVINWLVIILAKEAFGLPRPNFFDSELPLIHVRGFGFPSGGAELSMLLGCLLGSYWKSRWAWPLGLLYAFLVGFSRLWLGVHFPLDVLGGWAFGFAVFFAFRVMQKGHLF